MRLFLHDVGAEPLLDVFFEIKVYENKALPKRCPYLKAFMTALALEMFWGSESLNESQVRDAKTQQLHPRVVLRAIFGHCFWTRVPEADPPRAGGRQELVRGRKGARQAPVPRGSPR